MRPTAAHQTIAPHRCPSPSLPYPSNRAKPASFPITGCRGHPLARGHPWPLARLASIKTRWHGRPVLSGEKRFRVRVYARATSAHLPGHFGRALDAEAVSRENEKLTGLCANEFVVRARQEAAAPTGACAP